MSGPIVFDIDGTLTIGRYTADNLTDIPANRKVLDLALSFQKLGVPIIISTARPERFRSETEVWLTAFGVFPEEVFMDGTEGEKPNYMVKTEHCMKIEEEYGKPILWLDDELPNCMAIRALGVPCIQIQ